MPRSIKFISASVTLSAVILVLSLFAFSSVPKSSNHGGNGDFQFFQEHYRIHAFPIPDELYFAGERVPLERIYIREAFERELLVNAYWHSQTLLFLKRANRFFPVIEPILEREGVPADFKYLALIESGLHERALSPAGAFGIWQFLPDTAREYGLVVNNEIDERLHLERSTVAAARYLKDAHERFGSWTMAAAAYNAGMRGMQRQVDRQQESCYYNLILNEETGRYVFRILAVKEIISNPRKYGFYLDAHELYPIIEFNEVEVTTSIPSLVEFARLHGATFRQLKILNPWLRESALTNPSGKKYIIRVPKPGAFYVSEE